MAKPEDKNKTDEPIELHTANFSFEEENFDEALLTASGVWSASKSLITGGKQKGKTAPLHGWYRGIKQIRTKHDKDNAVKPYLASCEASGQAPDLAKIQELQENAPKGDYYVFDIVEPTIVVKGGQPLVQERGTVITHANVLLAEELDQYCPTNLDGSQRLDNIFRVKIMFTGMETTSNQRNLAQYAVFPKEAMPYREYINAKAEKVFGKAVEASRASLAAKAPTKALPAAPAPATNGG
jgi:enamine deaminase RidA (YjgF/YER057c/UK114 family)